MVPTRVPTPQDQTPLGHPGGAAGRLGLWGPWILMISGVGLVVTGFVLRSSAAVAAPGVVLGSFLLVLGALLPRLDGPLKVSMRGIEATVLRHEQARRIEGVALRDETVRPDKRVDLAEIAAVDFLMDPSVADLPGERLSDVAQVSYLGARNEYQAFERRVQQWVEREGWSVEDTSGRGAVDFVARRGDEVMLIEARLVRGPMTGERLEEATDRLRHAASTSMDEEPARALFVSAPALTPAAVQAAIMSGAKVYREDNTGFVRVDLGSEP
jgi:hypothetical protein